MRLGPREAWRGFWRKTPECPSCGGLSARHSRRHYDGFWSLVFAVRPMKCPDCGSYFAIGAKPSGWITTGDPIDLQVPFRPVESGERETDAGADADAPPESATLIAGIVRARGGCPRCGSDAVRPAAPGPHESIASRFHAKDLYRCLHCNASFKRANLMKLMAITVVLTMVLFGLIYSTLATLSSARRSPGPPKIKNNQLPPAPPPVLR